MFTDKRSSPSSHVVSFRLSPESFRELEKVCQRMQGGTPAEVAREMVCAFLQACGSPGELALSLSIGQLVRKAGDLTCEVNRLAITLGEKITAVESAALTAEHIVNPLLESEG